MVLTNNPNNLYSDGGLNGGAAEDPDGPYKVLIFGDGGKGETDFIRWLKLRGFPKWHEDISSLGKNIPKVLFEKKVDLKKWQVTAKQVRFHRKRNFQYYRHFCN